MRQFYGAEVSRKLRIIINLKSGSKPLTLFSGGLCLGVPDDHSYDYGNKGRDFYQSLMHDFDEIQVELDTGGVESFVDLDALIDELAKV